MLFPTITSGIREAETLNRWLLACILFSAGHWNVWVMRRTIYLLRAAGTKSYLCCSYASKESYKGTTERIYNHQIHIPLAYKVGASATPHTSPWWASCLFVRCTARMNSQNLGCPNLRKIHRMPLKALKCSLQQTQTSSQLPHPRREQPFY